MAAVTEVDDLAGQIVVGAIPANLTPSLDGLTDLELLILRRALTSTLLDAENLALTSGDSPAAAHGRCQRLVGRGLLEKVERGYRVPDAVVTPVRDQVRRRGWEVRQ